MIARFGLLQKRDDLSQEAFSAHWRNVHGPLAAQWPGLRRYMQHVVVNKEQFGIAQKRGPWDFDGMSELHFDTLEDMKTAVAQPVFGDALQDEGNVFKDVHLVVCEKHEVVPRKLDSGPFVKRMTALRKLDGMSDAEFRREWLEVHAGLVRQWPDVLGYVQNIVVDRYHDSRDESATYDELPIDGIVEFWFRDTETAAKLYASEIVQQTQRHAEQFLAEITPFFVETRQIV